MRRMVVSLVGVVLAVAGAACGGGSSSSSSTTTSSSSTQSGSTSGADQALAQQINLQASDFPAGWQSKPHSPSNTGRAQTRQLLSCIGASPSLANTTTNVDSPDFSQQQSPGELDASSNVSFAPTTAVATGAFQAFSSPKAASCVQSLLANELKTQNLPGIAPVAVTSTPVTVPAGDQAVAFTGTSSVTSQGTTLPIVFQVTVVVRGRAELSLETGGVAATFPQSLQQSLLTAMTGRAAQVPT